MDNRYKMVIPKVVTRFLKAGYGSKQATLNVTNKYLKQ